jgi:DNA-directed RNA polymerase specialized sigma24 family protein
MNRKEAYGTVRVMLGRWGRVAIICLRKQKEIKEYKDLLESVSDARSTALTGMPGGGQVSDKTAKAAERLMYLESKYQETIDTLTNEIVEELEFKKKMDELLKRIDDPAKSIVYMRYKYGWTYTKIAFETHYSPSWVQALEGVAVSKLERMMRIEKTV